MANLKELLINLERSSEQTVYERALSDAIFNSIGDGAIATDESGKIYRINKAALQILGKKKREVIGKWYPKIIISVTEDNKAIPPPDRAIARSFLQGKPISEHTFFRTKNGIKPVWVTVSPIVLNNKPVGAIEVFRDATKEYEVDRMKSEFISIASHQLRTPLSAINTYTQMLYGGYAGKLTEQQKNFMKTVLASVDRMNELIDELLNIARIESGKLKIHLADVDYISVIDAIIKESSHLATDKEITVNFVKEVDTLHITADPLLLKEVCANLFSNALKYTPHGGKVTIKVDKKNNELVLSVSDTGYGIPKSSQSSMFSKFYRAGNVTQRETYGTGLGLYLVKLVADTIGGKIWFESRENEGSTFYFAVPDQSGK